MSKQLSKCCASKINTRHDNGLSDYYQCNECMRWSYNLNDLTEQPKSDVKTAREIIESYVADIILLPLMSAEYRRFTGPFEIMKKSEIELTKAIESVRRIPLSDGVLWNEAIDAVLEALGLAKEGDKP